MRADQFVKIIERLKLTRASQRTAEAFGLSVRQLQKIIAGQSPVPRPVALLAIAYSKFGLPNPLWNPDQDRTDAFKEARKRIMGDKPSPSPAAERILQSAKTSSNP